MRTSRSDRLFEAGLFSHDLEALKGTGTYVGFPARADIIIGKNGLVDEAAEWYCLTFWKERPADQYFKHGEIQWNE